jgi:hypothetical protein
LEDLDNVSRALELGDIEIVQNYFKNLRFNIFLTQIYFKKAVSYVVLCKIIDKELNSTTSGRVDFCAHHS